MDIEIIKQLAWGVFPPAIFGLVLFALLWRKRDWVWTARRAALACLGMGLGFVPLAALIFGGIKLPPASSDQWLAPIAAILGLVGAGLALLRNRAAGTIVRIVLLVLIALVSAPWMTRTPLAAGAAAAAKAVGIIGIFVALSLATLAATRRLHDRLTGPLPMFLTMALLGAISQILILAYSGMKMAQGAGILAGMVGAGLLVSFFRRNLTLRGALDVPVLASGTALLQGFSADVPHAITYVLLLAASPWLALAPDVGPLTRVKGWKHVVLRIALALLPLLIALAMGKAATDADLAGH